MKWRRLIAFAAALRAGFAFAADAPKYGPSPRGDPRVAASKRVNPASSADNAKKPAASGTRAPSAATATAQVAAPSPYPVLMIAASGTPAYLAINQRLDSTGASFGFGGYNANFSGMLSMQFARWLTAAIQLQRSTMGIETTEAGDFYIVGTTLSAWVPAARISTCIPIGSTSFCPTIGGMVDTEYALKYLTNTDITLTQLSDPMAKVGAYFTFWITPPFSAGISFYYNHGLKLAKNLGSTWNNHSKLEGGAWLNIPIGSTFGLKLAGDFTYHKGTFSAGVDSWALSTMNFSGTLGLTLKFNLGGTPSSPARSVASSDGKRGGERKAWIEEDSGDSIPGLAWSDKDAIVGAVKKGATYELYAEVEGTFNQPTWTLVHGEVKVKPRNGSPVFKFKVALKGRVTPVELNAVAPNGEVRKAKFRLVVPKYDEYFARARGMKASKP